RFGRGLFLFASGIINLTAVFWRHRNDGLTRKINRLAGMRLTVVYRLSNRNVPFPVSHFRGNHIMTSILTNVAAMAALQTLRTIGNEMETSQARVSSGMRVGEAKDNAAYWSIATTMRSDNQALSAVQDALGLGAAKV